MSNEEIFVEVYRRFTGKQMKSEEEKKLLPIFTASLDFIKHDRMMYYYVQPIEEYSKLNCAVEASTDRSVIFKHAYNHGLQTVINMAKKGYPLFAPSVYMYELYLKINQPKWFNDFKEIFVKSMIPNVTALFHARAYRSEECINEFNMLKRLKVKCLDYNSFMENKKYEIINIKENSKKFIGLLN